MYNTYTYTYICARNASEPRLGALQSEWPAGHWPLTEGALTWCEAGGQSPFRADSQVFLWRRQLLLWSKGKEPEESALSGTSLLIWNASSKVGSLQVFKAKHFPLHFLCKDSFWERKSLLLNIPWLWSKSREPGMRDFSAVRSFRQWECPVTHSGACSVFPMSPASTLTASKSQGAKGFSLSFCFLSKVCILMGRLQGRGWGGGRWKNR